MEITFYVKDLTLLSCRIKRNYVHTYYHQQVLQSETQFSTLVTQYDCKLENVDVTIVLVHRVDLLIDIHRTTPIASAVQLK